MVKWSSKGNWIIISGSADDPLDDNFRDDVTAFIIYFVLYYNTRPRLSVRLSILQRYFNEFEIALLNIRKILLGDEVSSWRGDYTAVSWCNRILIALFLFFRSGIGIYFDDNANEGFDEFWRTCIDENRTAATQNGLGKLYRHLFILITKPICSCRLVRTIFKDVCPKSKKTRAFCVEAYGWE